MASILFYTSPAKGHLFPVIGSALELRSRGHEVHIRTLASEVERVRSLGLYCEPISADVEARELDDWKANSPLGAIERAMRTFGDRAKSEIDDLQTAIHDTHAEVLVIDTNSWGAQAVAEASGLPWALFQPYFTYLPAPGVPPFGPGLSRLKNPAGRMRDLILGKLIFSKLNKLALPAINSTRSELALDPVSSITETLTKPDIVLYFTSRDLEYPRDEWPDNFRFTGPGLWSPDTETPDWLDEIDHPLALVTCSTERQSDRSIVETALQSLPGEGFFVVATSASFNPSDIETDSSSGFRLEQFIPHDPVVKRASVVICHGGMGITQRALANGVPVVMIPFGRDQLEVARRVEFAGAGVRLMPKNLDVMTLRKAVRNALEKQNAARLMSRSLTASGNEQKVADLIEGLYKPVLTQ
jgi:MGT family glycosyltransferase